MLWLPVYCRAAFTGKAVPPMARVVQLFVMLLSVVVLLVPAVRGAGDSAITEAVRASDVAAVRKLIAARADVNGPSGDGSTPLLWATHKSAVEIARALIAAGARPDVSNNY